MSRPIIQVEGVSKRYRIGAREAGYRTIRDTLADIARAPLRLLRGESRPTQEDFWALQDVS